MRTDRGRVVYAVDKVRIYSKGAVAEHAERLFSQGVPGRLVLITCEDWNGEAYLSNVVVTATPVYAGRSAAVAEVEHRHEPALGVEPRADARARRPRLHQHLAVGR